MRAFGNPASRARRISAGDAQSALAPAAASNSRTAGEGFAFTGKSTRSRVPAMRVHESRLARSCASETTQTFEPCSASNARRLSAADHVSMQAFSGAAHASAYGVADGRVARSTASSTGAAGMGMPTGLRVRVMTPRAAVRSDIGPPRNGLSREVGRDRRENERCTAHPREEQ